MHRLEYSLAREWATIAIAKLRLAAAIVAAALTGCSEERVRAFGQSLKPASDAASAAVGRATETTAAAIGAGGRSAGELFDAAGKKVDEVIPGTPREAPTKPPRD